MRHAKKRYKLGRTAAHRKATLASLSVALIQHKKIKTTITKAKALRIFVEPLITRARTDTTHNRREVFRHLQDKAAVTELFNEISLRVGDRPGGYTRVVRMGPRYGDATEMAVIELVDYNDSVREDATPRRRRTRRSRRRRASDSTPVAAVPTVEIDSTLDVELDDQLLESVTEDEKENLNLASDSSEPYDDPPSDEHMEDPPAEMIDDDVEEVTKLSSPDDALDNLKKLESTGDEGVEEEPEESLSEDVQEDVSDDSSLDENVTEELPETPPEEESPSSMDGDELEAAEPSDEDVISSEDTTPPHEESDDAPESDVPEDEKDQPPS